MCERPLKDFYFEIFSGLQVFRPGGEKVVWMNVHLNLQDSILKIKGVKESDEATYQCKATNQLGTSYSSGQLKVLSKYTSPWRDYRKGQNKIDKDYGESDEW